MTRRYYHDELGINSRLDTLQAAILLVKLPHIDAWNQRRRALAAHVITSSSCALASPPCPRPQNRTATIADGSGAAVHGTARPARLPPVRDPRATPRRAPRAPHGRSASAAKSTIPLPIHLQAAAKHLGHKPGDFPETERASAEVLALPMYPELREDEQEIVVEAIRRFYG